MISMEAEFSSDVPPFAWHNQFPVRIPDGMQRSIDFVFPKFDVLGEFGKLRCDVEDLQPERIQDRTIVRNMVGDFDGGKTVAFEHHLDFVRIEFGVRISEHHVTFRLGTDEAHLVIHLRMSSFNCWAVTIQSRQSLNGGVEC